jgi:FKBP-type peptidyl-prolyl cis-trans isomerase
MRRAAALVVTPLIAVGAVAALAGCGSSSSSSASAPADTYKSVTATGAFGAAPKVTIPAAKANGPLYTKTLIQGTGAPLTTSESLLGNFVLYDWTGSTHKLLGSTYRSGSPTLLAGQMLPGLEKALIGQKAGSRVLAVIPPAQGFGSTGNPNIGVGKTDTLVFVIDMIQELSNTAGVPGTQTSNGGGALPTVTTAPGKAPAVTIPASAPPKTLQVKTLIKGTGAKVTAGKLLVAQYVGVNWRTKKVFDASWSRGQLLSIPIGVGQVIKGWDTGLVGQTVGSRVLLVIPPAAGYGKTGSATAGIKGTDTLVFVVDILAAG